MNEEIRDDVGRQVERFVTRVRSTFDPDRYPRLEDGPAFDGELVGTVEEFAALQRLFHDYLVAIWAEESARALSAASQPEAPRSPRPARGS